MINVRHLILLYLCVCVCVCMQEALKVMEFSEEEIREMFKLLSGVLQLGNVEFMTAGGAQITTKQGENCYREAQR